MSENLFGSDQTPVVETPVAPIPEVAPVASPVDTVPPELADLVGEGKKYKTVADAMTAIPHAQTHINTLKADNDSMKEELARRSTAEELLADMRNSTPVAQATPASTEVNPDVISEIVKQQLANINQADVQKQNSDSVVGAFTAKYADKAEVMFNKLALDNGMTVADVNALAKKSPQVILNLAGLTNAVTPSATSISNDVNQQSHFGSAPATVTSRVTDYGKSGDVALGMANAKAIVAARLNN